MKRDARWRRLGWRHELWELVRYFRALRSGADVWLEKLKRTASLDAGEHAFAVSRDLADSLSMYVDAARLDFEIAFAALRDETGAKAFCASLGAVVGTTTTRSKDHHQSSKALVTAVNAIASQVCASARLQLNSNPQRRAIWLTDRGLHVSARNLDGAIPGLENPFVVWEIKEYWGKTAGGSKMSDAVYECQLVGREIREYEERSGARIFHVVFVDGREQWSSRRSDLVRFLDLFHQGLIDELIVGEQVEKEWRMVLSKLLAAPPGTSRS